MLYNKDEHCSNRDYREEVLHYERARKSKAGPYQQRDGGAEPEVQEMY